MAQVESRNLTGLRRVFNKPDLDVDKCKSHTHELNTETTVSNTTPVVECNCINIFKKCIISDIK